ncbi:hypothetical protein D3C87_1653360 [compost metagenome]
MPGHTRAVESGEGSATVVLLPTEVLMEWWVSVALFGLVWYEFFRVAKHVNQLKDDVQNLKKELRGLRERVVALEVDDDDQDYSENYL